jgi:uncharacterized protein
MSTAAIPIDDQSLPSGAPEELAGPPHTIAPVSRKERISSVDTLRGVALLGILAMNITSFGLPSWAYAIPLSTPMPVFNGPHWKANTIAWFLRWILAEGKMRALFSMLFGAGAILLTSRAADRGAADRAADIFTRRNMWLMLFGALHCYLIWYGDILYFYGLMGLLFLYPMRNLKPKTLFWWAGVILLLNSAVVGFGQLAGAYHARAQAAAANKLLSQHKTLTDDQVDDLKSWKDWQDRWRPPQKKIDEDMKAMHGGYIKAQAHNAKEAFDSETIFSYIGFGDVLGFMLLGMGLYRNGFLTAKLSTKTYTIIALLGLGISWPLIFLGCWHAWKSGFDQFTSMWWLNVPYELGRVTGALGNAAVVLLVIKSGALQWITRRLAAVGQMALSNYLLTSTTCKFLFVWGPLHWYGRMEYFHLYYVMAGVWAVNLIWSPLWLKYFQFGPAEWVWRSLTYWKKQPMRLQQPA